MPIDDPGNAGTASSDWPESRVALPDRPQPVRDYGTSWLRTAVPVAWGALVTFLFSRVPELHEALVNPGVTMAVTGVVVAAWYSLFRAIENRLPRWLTAFLLGSNAQPIYHDPVTLKAADPARRSA
jgi:hypothetical protein